MIANQCVKLYSCRIESFRDITEGNMKSPVTISSFDLTTGHDLIKHLVGLSVDSKQELCQD